MAEIELTPSVPVTPSEPPKEEPAEAPKEAPAAEVPTVKLYKLPDGREVDADTVMQEYTNLLPEFTRKSQRVAELEGKSQQPEVPDWKKEGYVPKSYAELVELGKAEALKEISAREAAEAAKRAEISASVDAAVAAIKARDPKLDEDALFTHANKYGFRDLNLAYENMQEIKKVATVTEERVLKGAGKKIDPIATGTGAGSGSAPRYPQATSATEFLQRLKK
jgi:hypothetical protein